jgi:hypothetical protein
MSGFSLIVCKCNDASNVILPELYEKPTQPKMLKFIFANWGIETS